MKVELLFLVVVILGLDDSRVAGQSESPVVSLRAGQLRGTTADTFSRRVYAFKGIPYAKPPVGKRRFKDPEYLKHWIGVWNATKAPPPCLQFNRMPASRVDGDEDCLYLNVYTPSLTPTAGPLPVIFYIHGGAFMYGGSKNILPTSLLEHDVVLVTTNYRLGPLGFLSTGDDAMPGNFGLKDQAMALRWVQDNIAAFGGDPARVTLAGNSAGGASVHFHYLSQLSKGLFARGISMSGTSLNPWTVTEKPAEKATRLAELLGCPTSNTRDLTTCLRHRPARDIVDKVPLFQVWKELPFTPFGPVVEPPGLNRFLDKAPVDVIANREVSDLPWMTGFTTHEGIYPTNEIIFEQESMKYLQDNWKQLCPLLLDFNDTAADPGTLCQQVLKRYFADANIHESIPKLIELVGDRIFKVGIIEAAKLMASVNTAKVYLYQYEHRAQRSYTELYNGDKTDHGVSHADDILILLYQEYDLKSTSEQDKAVSRALGKIWEKYAADGTVDWSPVDTVNGVLTLVRLKQNAETEEIHIRDIGNVEYWKSIPIEENILTQTHTEL